MSTVSYLLLIALLAPAPILGDGVLFCYIRSSSFYNEAPFKFAMDKIDPFLCTHVVFGYLRIEKNKVVPTSLPGPEILSGMAQLRLRNPQLLFLASIGGNHEGLEEIFTMTSFPILTRHFIESVTDFLIDNDFDGVDFSWRSPGQMEEDFYGLEEFLQVLKDLRAALRKHRFIVTASIHLQNYSPPRHYYLKDISQTVDFLLVKVYNYNKIWNDNDGHVESQNICLEKVFNMILKRGVSSRKLVLGFDTRGSVFRTLPVKPFLHFFLPVESLPPLKISGPSRVGYNWICQALKHPDWQEGWDDEAHTAYAESSEGFYIYFHSERTFNEKAKLAKKLKLAGASVWTLNADDFNGDCDSNKYPLTSQIQNYFNNPMAVRLQDDTYPIAGFQVSYNIVNTCIQDGL